MVIASGDVKRNEHCGELVDTQPLLVDKRQQQQMKDVSYKRLSLNLKKKKIATENINCCLDSGRGHTTSK